MYIEVLNRTLYDEELFFIRFLNSKTNKTISTHFQIIIEQKKVVEFLI